MNAVKKIIKLLHHALFGFIAVLAFGAVEETAAYSGLDMSVAAYFGIPRIAVLLIAMSVFLLASGKIITYEHRHVLKGTNAVFWEKKYIIATACALAVLLACSAAFFLLQDTVLITLDNSAGGVTAEDVEAMQNAAVNSVVLLLGPFFLWMLFLKNMASDRDRNWPGTVITFIRTDVSVYLIFRAAVFLLCLVSALLMGLRSSNVQNSYFLFMLDDEQIQSIATGSLAGGGSFLSGITGAASFYVLISMAEDSLSGAAKCTRKEQLRGFFLDKDTVKLIAMTLSGIVAGMLSAGDGDTLLTHLVKTAFILLWLISSLLFLADTAIMPYMIIFTTLGFIERILPLPEVGGLLVLVYPLIIIARILLFSVAAVMIAHHQLERKKALSAELAVTGRPGLSHRLWNATFLDALRLILRIGESGFSIFRKNAPVSAEEQDLLDIVSLARAGNDCIDHVIDKLTQKLDDRQNIQ